MTRVLDDVEAFLARFVAYPSDAARVAHTLWIGHTWFMHEWESTPRIAFLSPEPGSGKSRALEVTEPLVPRPVHAVNTTPSYLFRKVSDPEGLPTILYDEIDTVFGPKAKDNEDVRGMLNAGHRRGAVAGRCVVKGRTIETEELPAYCAVALAGLNDVPDTIMSRSVVIRMRRRSPSEKVEPWRQRLNSPEAAALGVRLSGWAASSASNLTWPDMPSGVEDRNADVWEPLLAVADLAGGKWPELARVSAVSLVSELQQEAPTLGVALLRDLRSVFDKGDGRLSTEDVLAALHAMGESPWAQLHGGINARWLSRQLGKYGVKPKVMRIGPGGSTVRGYDSADLADPWERYASPAAVSAAEPSVSLPLPPAEPDVSSVSDVTYPAGDGSPAGYAGSEASWNTPHPPTDTRDATAAPLYPGKSETAETTETQALPEGHLLRRPHLWPDETDDDPERTDSTRCTVRLDGCLGQLTTRLEFMTQVCYQCSKRGRRAS